MPQCARGDSVDQATRLNNGDSTSTRIMHNLAQPRTWLARCIGMLRSYVMHKAQVFKKQGVYAYHLCALQPRSACSIEPRIHMHTDTCKRW